MPRFGVSVAYKLIEGAAFDGGITLGRTSDYFAGKEYRKYEGHGYVVGGKVPSLILKWEATHPYLSLFKERWNVVGWVEDNYSDFYGSWVNEGKAYFDAVDILQDRTEASELARNRGELAIYDLKNGKDIVIDGVPDLQPAYFGGYTDESGEVYGG